MASWRASEADLPARIALFPLEGALLLPRGRLPLHIFEPRYLTMIEDALKTRERIIGMIQPLGDGLHRIGCAGRITSFAETEDGRYLVTLGGISRFVLGPGDPAGDPYLCAEVSWTPFARDLGPAETDSGLDRSRFLENLGRFLEAHELSTDWSSLKDAEDEMLINALSMLLPFEPEERQALLEAPGLAERRDILTTLMEFTLHGGVGEEPIQ